MKIDHPKGDDKLSARDRRQHFDEVLFSTHLKPVDKLVSYGIMLYVNDAARCTYVDLLTVAKRLGVKHPKVLASFGKLVTEKHWERFGGKYIRPLLRNDCIKRSVKGDKDYYRWRGAQIEQVATDKRLTPAERVSLMGRLLFTWPDGTCELSSREVQNLFGVNHEIASRCLRTVYEVSTSESTSAQSTGTSEDNSVNSGDSTLCKNKEHHLAMMQSPEESKGKEERKESSEEERRSAISPSDNHSAETTERPPQEWRQCFVFAKSRWSAEKPGALLTLLRHDGRCSAAEVMEAMQNGAEQGDSFRGSLDEFLCEEPLERRIAR
jgi:hypothetical protein